MTSDFLSCVQRSIAAIDGASIDHAAAALSRMRETGRLYIIGNGGGAAHASHACCDFRKLCGFDAHCPADNVAELTARTNDEGWWTVYAEWLRGCHLDFADALMVVSVGGGSAYPAVSTNIVRAVQFALIQRAMVFAIVGRDGGYTGKNATHRILIPCDEPKLVTPVTEGVQAVVLHALACHPLLQQSSAKWEGIQNRMGAP